MVGFGVFFVAMLGFLGPVRAAQESPEPIVQFKSVDCEKCHVGVEVDPGTVKDYPKTLPHVNWAAFRASIHSRSGMECTDCHSEGYGFFPHKSGRLLTCFDCHEKVQKEFRAIEASLVKSHHSDLLGCGDCHKTHEMKPANEQTVFEKDKGCVSCHQDTNAPKVQMMTTSHDWHPQAALHLNTVPCIACHTAPEEGNPGFSHRILPKEEATRICTDCHSHKGKMVHYLTRIGHAPDTEKDQENLVHSFYITGSTRLPALDNSGLILLLLVTLGVLVHVTVRIVSRRKS